MAIVSIIVAIDCDNAIGKGNALLCHLPADLKYFKKITQGHTVIMGKNTYLSLPNGALPNRRNIVLTRDNTFKAESCEIASSLEEALELCASEYEVFIIGGGMLYKEALAYSDKLYVTHIWHKFEGADTFFPPIDKSFWCEISRGDNAADEKNIYPYSFAVYQRIKQEKG
jgi:dihydrofolate reductase